MKYTAEQMQLVIEEWEASGISKKAFCRGRGIGYQSFHYWYKRLKVTAATGFVSVPVNAVGLRSQESRESCEIVFPSGARIILRGEPSASWLRTLLW